METQATEAAIPADRLVRTYMKMRDKREALAKELEEKLSALDEKMKFVKAALLDHCKTNGVDSIRTPNGVAYRTVRTVYSTSDWESFHKFVLDNEAPYLLEKRLHQGNMKEFVADNPELIPPGLNSSNEYTVTIRRK